MPIGDWGEALTASILDTGGTDHAIGLSALLSAINSGDLLLVFLTTDGGGSHDWSGISGWTKANEWEGGDSLTSFGWKIASGSETTITPTTAAAEESAAIIIRIDGGLFDTGTPFYITYGQDVTDNANPDPPNLAPGAGSLDTIWFCGYGCDGSRALSTVPTDYTAVDAGQATGGGGGCGTGAAYREVNAESQDPGTFTIAAADDWNSFTLAINPAAGGLSATVNQVSETDLAQPISKAKLKAMGQIAETDLSQTIGPAKGLTIGQVTEGDIAQAIANVVKTKTIGQIVETDVANVIAVFGDQIIAVNRVIEADSSQAINRIKTTSIGQVVETDLSRPVFGADKIVLVLQILETDLSQSITSVKYASLEEASETDAAIQIRPAKGHVIGQVLESDSVQPLLYTKIVNVGALVETDLSRPITFFKVKSIGFQTEVDLAMPVSEAGQIITLVNQVIESDLLQPIAALKDILASIGQVSESDISQAIDYFKVKNIGQTQEIDAAFSMGGILEKTFGINQVIENDLAFPIYPPDDIYHKKGTLILSIETKKGTLVINTGG